jgi:hypothetical protein
LRRHEAKPASEGGHRRAALGAAPRRATGPARGPSPLAAAFPERPPPATP